MAEKDNIQKKFTAFKVDVVYVNADGKVSLTPKEGFKRLTKAEFEKKISKTKKITENGQSDNNN